MCNKCSPTIAEKIPDKKFKLADFFNSWWDIYAKNPKKYIRPEQYKAVNAIRVCRTAALGTDVYACPECGQTSEIFHSCKNRFCPTCSWKDTVVWAEQVKLRMLNIPHRHIVCTLPHSLTGIIKRNQYVLLGTLMRTSADVFKDWMLNKYGIKIGIISVLHSFGEVKDWHAHVHMIVSWGGIRPKYNTLKIIGSEYVKYNFLQKKFRCKFEDELIAMFDNGELDTDFTDRQDFMRFIKEVNNNDWVIHLEPPMDTPEKVIRYIGRYSKRACLSEYKITNIVDEFISFRYKDNRDRDENKKPKEKILELHYRDFFPRLLQHVPLPNFKLVRYYGLYSNKGSVPQEYLYKKEEENIPVEEEKQEDPKQCKECGIEKEYIHTIFDRRERNERTTIFDINIHIHLIVIRYKRNAA
jgi:hypothetical protein